MLKIPTEPDYFERRAEEELEAAQRASHPAAVRAHYELADLYLNRLHTPRDQRAKHG